MEKITIPENRENLSTPDFKKQLKQRKLKIKQEEQEAIHLLKLGIINNAPPIIIILLVILICIIIDFYTCLFYWKNPSLLFIQIKRIFPYLITFILGMVADNIRKKMIK